VRFDLSRANTEGLRLWRHEVVYRIRRFRFTNNKVVGLETALVPARLCPDLEKKESYRK
jgi:DNA-binding GntR family transcriptional regulator